MCKLIMMVGLPASGKSHYAKEIALKENASIHASDELRQELFGDREANDKNGELFIELHRRIKNDLKQGKSVVYDACSISYKRRKIFLEELKHIDCEKICYFIATPYEKCLEQNKSRERFVPEYVIKKMYLNFYVPQYYEGWNRINIIWNTEGYKFDTHILFNGEDGLNYINQDNPNHTLTIGQHCFKCHDLCEGQLHDFELNMAALYHDIGKRFTKQFKDAKGEPTDIAHYYQHHLVSAYESMFYMQGFEDDTILAIANYIQWHMNPFFLQSEKARNKFINLVSQKVYNKIMILHEADKMAH